MNNNFGLLRPLEGTRVAWTNHLYILAEWYKAENDTNLEGFKSSHVYWSSEQ